MAFKIKYAESLKNSMPCFSYKRDSFWSWLLVGIAFLNKLINIGIMFALGSFFDAWKIEFSQSTILGPDFESEIFSNLSHGHRYSLSRLILAKHKEAIAPIKQIS